MRISRGQYLFDRNSTLLESSLGASQAPTFFRLEIRQIETQFYREMEVANVDDEKAILDYVNRSLNEEEEFHFLRFESLQRTNIVRLQLRLIRLKNKLRIDEAVSASDHEDLQVALRDYGERESGRTEDGRHLDKGGADQRD